MAYNTNGSWSDAARRMVDEQIEARGVRDPAVLAAMRAIPRHAFIPEQERHRAYADEPVPIGYDQTISQPYIVGLMTALVQPTLSSRILEIGTGCGYQSAILAACAAEVYTIELEHALSERALETLRALGIENVHGRVGDGADGWPEAAPFDGILVTAAPAEMPPKLLDQLAVGGRIVIPLGTTSQNLYVFVRDADGVRRQTVLPVRFVPLR